VYPKAGGDANEPGTPAGPRSLPRRLREERAERLQAGIDVVVGVVVNPVIERETADDAEARAVRAIERRDWLGEQDRLADGPLEVELVVVGEADDVVLLVRRIGRQHRAAVHVDGRTRLLLELRHDRDLDVAETANALHRE
jgi:hypothetical protein